MKTVRKAAAIKPGDTIGIIALSAPCREDSLKAGIEKIESLGYRVKVALDPARYYGSKKHMFASDSAVKRLKALKELLKDPEIRCILAVRGGYGALPLMNQIDFKTFYDNPKLLVGYSDFSAVLLGAYAEGLITFHGPSLISSFSQPAEEEGVTESIDALLNMVSGNSFNVFNGHTLRHLCGPSKCQGELVGANLTYLAFMQACRFNINFDNKILFFEEVGEKPYKLHRLLLQLKLSGCLNKLAGVVVGSLSGCNHPANLGPTAEEVITDIFCDLDIPVYLDAPFGHSNPNFTIPLGVKATLSNNKLELNESPVLD
ncbi:MAG: LD-carboxypeptidase [Candidatus Dadabacteria bacterium]|nr:MAG: LD-carboxypeptidase [Candidatus Dadabacteria bacterium]